MRITVLFDERTERKDLKTGFGLSLLVDDTVLFDTGSDGESLVHNIRTLNIDVYSVKNVVVSHEHWDHSGGLAEVLSILPRGRVYVCPFSSERLKRRVRDCGGVVTAPPTPGKVAGCVYSTGEIHGDYKGQPMPEQSLFVVYDNDRVALICGCAHYGIAWSIGGIRERIAEFLGRQIVVDSIVGGLHLSHESDDTILRISEELYESGVRRIAPLHCSGANAREVLSRHGRLEFHDLMVGSVLEI